jgi:hypothetical protein
LEVAYGSYETVRSNQHDNHPNGKGSEYDRPGKIERVAKSIENRQSNKTPNGKGSEYDDSVDGV